ncbi:transmembrane protein 150A isoform X2 [Phycodurus eques]|uniref:transmembrane protein 150A isoform X2 n=1 Tax=Phycodurus eques TaxID=693459 RepID=UPI002ACEF1A2|nr:transmembrane protein 150A isoform X2 [Phycodurus eques]
MWLWIFFPVALSLTSFIGTWAVWGENFCTVNHTKDCCRVPTISTSGAYTPENSLFTATINAGSFLFFLFCIFHHAHVMEKNACHAPMSRLALFFGLVASLGSFAAGNCNPSYLTLLHHVGAGVSFMCICCYTVLLTALTGRCLLTGYEYFLYPLRIVFTVQQTILTLCYAFCFAHQDYYNVHLSAVFEWILSANLELFELSYVVEFSFFSPYMLSNLYSHREEERPFMLA